METTQHGAGVLQLLLLAPFIILAILFLLTQQNTLKIVQPDNRLMKPGLVWLQLIPIFGQLWQFFVVSRIAGSIRKELEFRQEDTLLGVFDTDAAAQVGKKPTFVIGITYCLLNITGILMNTFMNFGPGSSLLFLPILVFLSSTVCWIIYWVQLAAEKRIMAELKPAVA